LFLCLTVDRDDETGLDFAEARMYQNRHGRFTAPDPLLASASAADPQTFNRYIYTGNNPANYSDQSGLSWCRNAGNGATAFTGQGVACESGWENVDGQVVKISGGDWSRERAKPGDIVKLNADGTVKVLESSPEAEAIAQGQSAVNVSVEVSGQSAADGAAGASNGSLVAAGASALGGTIQSRGLLPLPCVADDGVCGNGNIPLPDLGQGAGAEETLDAVQTAADTVGLIPGLGEPADAVSGVISLGRGDLTGAGLSAAALIPFIGDAAGGTKIARRLSKGGRYAELLGEAGREVHHIPADSVTNLGKREGPAIHMLTGDHRLTSSWGNSDSAKAYRANLKSLIEGGGFRKAVATEIYDVRRIGGRGYNPALLEMLGYAKKRELLRK
jgi:RHS repeat-associated protein